MGPSLVVPILVGGLIAGSLDLTSAFLTFGWGVPRAIAAGLLGRQALHGGVDTVDSRRTFTLPYRLLVGGSVWPGELEARVPQVPLPRVRHVFWNRGLSYDEPDRAAPQRATRHWAVAASGPYPGDSRAHVPDWRADRLLFAQVLGSGQPGFTEVDATILQGRIPRMKALLFLLAFAAGSHADLQRPIITSKDEDFIYIAKQDRRKSKSFGCALATAVFQILGGFRAIWAEDRVIELR